MALDLYLQKDASLPAENPLLSFEDDGYYWFLYSFFEDLSKQTDQIIDRCEDAFFDGKTLDLFDEMIGRIRTEIAQKPEMWNEFVGTIIHQDSRKVEKMYSTVHKSELELILIKLENAVSEARNKNIGIFFFGD